MIFFSRLKRIQEQLATIEGYMSKDHRYRSGVINLIDEVQKLHSENGAYLRQMSHSTFNLDNLGPIKPEHGTDWKNEEQKLNKKGKK